MLNEQELKNQIIERAWADDYFKHQLLTDPKAAIRDAFGVDVPDHIEIEVLEENSEKYYLVLPQNPSQLHNTIIQGSRWI
ncbi:NHLP leader peptide family RiPP precursor [Paenibacillus sp. L3-i20]|uniref:NHLP leader peptide family RiPP precursor n=1 Tax=Paenibacillus sp. L3-i20 TaxID=2905833 RepID=UPI001EE09D76|nr:NHLP leader peptide family RiPP precursor [Paenibacillus sp. L3-i20]GKU76266.1 hypothetical protein L3i20_v206630 [Paenibacillus sp. L3-i20]